VITNSKKSKSISQLNKITLSGLIIALYVSLMFFTQGFAFGQYQIRIATSLYSLTAIFPFLIVPMGISNFLSNTLMGGLGVLDMFGGLFVGILTSSVVYAIRKYRLNDWFISIPIIFGPGLIVPIWLSYLINVPYKILAISIIIGQIIPGVVGVIIVKQLKNKIQ